MFVYGIIWTGVLFLLPMNIGEQRMFFSGPHLSGKSCVFTIKIIGLSTQKCSTMVLCEIPWCVPAVHPGPLTFGDVPTPDQAMKRHRCISWPGHCMAYCRRITCKCLAIIRHCVSYYFPTRRRIAGESRVNVIRSSATAQRITFPRVDARATELSNNRTAARKEHVLNCIILPSGEKYCYLWFSIQSH